MIFYLGYHDKSLLLIQCTCAHLKITKINRFEMKNNKMLQYYIKIQWEKVTSLL